MTPQVLLDCVYEVAGYMADGGVHLWYYHVLYRTRAGKHQIRVHHALVLVERRIHVNGLLFFVFVQHFSVHERFSTRALILLHVQ